MKTEPLTHQVFFRNFFADYDRPYYGLLCEQGTGKTWMMLSAMEHMWRYHGILLAVVIAPKSVHPNWTRREIPQHLEIPHEVLTWRTGRKDHERIMERWRFRKNDITFLRIVSINYQAVITPKGQAFLNEVMDLYRTALILDESVTIKNPKSATSQKIRKLAQNALRRFILTGTPITRAPQDFWAQLEFLQPGLSGHSTYRGFMNRYCELLPANHPLVQTIVRKTKCRGTPPIVRQDENGNPVYRNLDELSARIKPFTFRVTKDEALDLPPKIYMSRYYTLTKDQRSLYDELARTHGFVSEAGGEITIAEYNAATANLAVAQVNSGILPAQLEGTPMATTQDFTPLDNPKMRLLLEILEDEIGDNQVIIWARFHAEIFAIQASLNSSSFTSRLLHGPTKEADRQANIDDFQAGKYQVLIANPQAGGEGITLTAAHDAIYYSNDYNFRSRAQSEDRCHRKGTQRSVNYYDLIAVDTIDEAIIESLQRKEYVLRRVVDS